MSQYPSYIQISPKWFKSCTGWIKVNLDALVCYDINSIGLRAVLRNDSSAVIVANSNFEVEEATGILNALTLGVDKGYHISF